LHGGSPRTDARATAVSTIPISNAHVERLLRVVSTFRKNSLFVGSLEAGERYANLLTVLLNCELAGVNPYVYLVDVIDKIADDWPADRAAELLPRAWLAARQAEQQAPGEAAPSWSRSSSRIAQPLSHPPRHRSQMVTVGRIRRQARRPPGPPVASPPVPRAAGRQGRRSPGSFRRRRRRRGATTAAGAGVTGGGDGCARRGVATDPCLGTRAASRAPRAGPGQLEAVACVRRAGMGHLGGRSVAWYPHRSTPTRAWCFRRR